MVLPLSIATIFSAEEPVWEAFTGVQLACLAVSLIFLFVFFFMDRKKNNFIERSFVQLNLTNEFEEEGEEEDGDNNESLAMVQIKLKDQKVDIEKSQDDEIDQEDLELGQNKPFNYKQLENDDENENEDDDFDYMNSTEKIKLKDWKIITKNKVLLC